MDKFNHSMILLKKILLKILLQSRAFSLRIKKLKKQIKKFNLKKTFYETDEILFQKLCKLKTTKVNKKNN